MMSILVFLFALGCADAGPAKDQEMVFDAIRDALKGNLAAGDPTLRVQTAGMDLNGDGSKEVIAYI